MNNISLFGDDFDININQEKTSVKSIVNKIKNVQDQEVDSEKILKSKKISLDEKLLLINEKVLAVLGKQKNNIQVIKSKDDFYNYITAVINTGVVALDTETNNSTDTVTCKLMGLCLYAPGLKQAYIPVNHVDIKTNIRLDWQLTEQDCKEQIQRLINANVSIITHNGKFDYEVIKCTCGIAFPIAWDTLVGARILDENKYSEKRTSLKYIYTTEIDQAQEKYSIDGLFENIPYRYVDPDIFAYYAATDSLMTYKVYLWELDFFQKPENSPLLKLLKTIEFPIIPVTAEMELKGVYIDQELGARLKDKYMKQLSDLDIKIADAIKELKPEIDNWKLSPEANNKSKIYVSTKSKMSDDKIAQSYPLIDADGRRYKEAKPKVEQLEDPINLGSPVQLAILFYDILKCPQVSKKSPRGTGEEELEAIAEKRPDLKVCKLLIERRGLVKLIATYIDVIPALAKHWPDGRIRYRLSSVGTDTGRFASGGKFRFLDENDNPVVLNSINSQNIPSHNPEVRLLFKAAPGYRIVGSDYSGQELRLAAYLSQDKILLQSYAEGKDVYAMIASMITGYPYDECLEFYPEGTEIEIDGQKIICGHKTHTNKAGKERRSIGKVAVLAGNYGMSGAGAGSLMGKSAKEGKEMLDKYFSMFPGLKAAIDKSKELLLKNGYVTDLIGRRRHLPDIYLPAYEAKYLDEQKNNQNFNPIICCEDRNIEDPTLLSYITKAKATKTNKDFDVLAKDAYKHGILLTANTGRIAQAERQCFNATIQGSAGTLTKKAMIDIFNDQQLRAWRAELIITVHDEVLVECPEEYAEQVEKRLPEIMINAAKELGITQPNMQCDPYNVSRWYADSAAVAIRDEFSKLEKKCADSMPAEDVHKYVLEKVIENHKEFPANSIISVIENGSDLDF